MDSQQDDKELNEILETIKECIRNEFVYESYVDDEAKKLIQLVCKDIVKIEFDILHKNIESVINNMIRERLDVSVKVNKCWIRVLKSMCFWRKRLSNNHG